MAWHGMTRPAVHAPVDIPCISTGSVALPSAQSARPSQTCPPPSASTALFPSPSPNSPQHTRAPSTATPPNSLDASPKPSKPPSHSKSPHQRQRGTTGEPCTRHGRCPKRNGPNGPPTSERASAMSGARRSTHAPQPAALVHRLGTARPAQTATGHVDSYPFVLEGLCSTRSV
jgi:hypothetical protein